MTNHSFKHPYLPSGFFEFTITNIVICIHAKHHIIAFVLEITQELAQISNE